MVKNILNKNGFTLLESVVYSALLSVFMLGLVQLVFSVLKSSEYIVNKNNIEREVRFVIVKFNWALSKAKVISFVENGVLLSDGSLGNVKFLSLPDKTLSMVSEEEVFLLHSQNLEFYNVVFTPLPSEEQSSGLRIDMDVNCKNCSSRLQEHFWYSAYLKVQP